MFSTVHTADGSHVDYRKTVTGLWWGWSPGCQCSCCNCKAEGRENPRIEQWKDAIFEGNSRINWNPECPKKRGHGAQSCCTFLQGTQTDSHRQITACFKIWHDISEGWYSWKTTYPRCFFPVQGKEELEKQKVAPTEVTAGVPPPPSAEPPSDQDG